MKLDPSSLLSDLLGEATRLTQSGRLADATAAIQRALGMTPTAEAPSHTHPDTRAGTPTDPNVLDGLVRDADPGVAAPLEPGAEPGFSAGTFTSDIGSRHYKLFVPKGFNSRRVPLVVMLHGCTQDPDDFAAGTRMNALAAEQGVVVLYPAQAPRSNASKCWNWFVPADQQRDAGEPALLAAMTAHVVATQAIDPDRVYVAGLSAGGAMAAILGREYPDMFAAIGVHSGLPAGAAHDVMSAFSAMQNGPSSDTAVAAATPVIVFHGDSDTTVHPANGEQLVGGLAAAASAASASDASGRAFTHRTYRNAAGEVQAEHWLVHGAGHAWSGGSSEGSFADASGPDASREMLRFFLAHPRAKRTHS